jgi:hypothetical protein
MNRRDSFRLILVLGFALSLAGVLSAQGTQEKTLVVNGKTAAEGIRQIDGHSYVDIEALAQLTNAEITVQADRVILTIPLSQSVTAPSAPTPQVAQPVQPVQGLSREFASAAIAAVAEMRGWRGVIETMVTYGLAVSGTWTQDYRDQVDGALRQATLAASTDADRSALQLLQNEFGNLEGWSSDVEAARKILNGAKTVDPNALANDPALTKITNCSRFLNGMLVSGEFSDDGSCH